MLFVWERSWWISLCVRLGTACSAFVIQSVGATDGLKDYDTVRRFMEEAGELKITFI